MQRLWEAQIDFPIIQRLIWWLAGRVKYVVKQTLLSEIPKCSKYSSDL